MARHFKENFPRFKAVGEILGVEFEMVKKDGSRILVSFNGKIALDRKGRFQQTHCIFTDITERRRTEAALIESAERLKEAQKIARIGQWELDLITNKLDWSDSIYELFEIAPNEFGASYEAFLNFVHPADRDRVGHAYTRSLADRTPYEIEHRLLMPDGRVKWVAEACRTDYDQRRETPAFGRHRAGHHGAQAGGTGADLPAGHAGDHFRKLAVHHDAGRPRTCASGAVNRVGEDSTGRPKEALLDLLCGEVVHCVNSVDRRWVAGETRCAANAWCARRFCTPFRQGEAVFESARASSSLSGGVRGIDAGHAGLHGQGQRWRNWISCWFRWSTSRTVRAEEELQASEERYRLLFEEMTSAFALHKMFFDESGKPCDYEFLQVNPAFEKLTGLSAGDVVGRQVFEVLPDIELSWIARYGNVVLTGEPLRFEDYNRPLDKHFEVRAFKAGPGQFAVVFQDITERKLAAEALIESETNFRLLVETAPDAIFIQTGGRIAYLNAAALNLFGADSAGQIVGRPLLERVHPDFHAAVRERSRMLSDEPQPRAIHASRFI